MTTLTFEDKLGFIKKNIEERVSRAGGVPERLYEDIVSFFTTCEPDPKKRGRIEECFRKADFKNGIYFSINKMLGVQIPASLEPIKEPLEQSYLLAYFLENLLILEYSVFAWDVLPPQLILPIKFLDGEREKKYLKDYLPDNTDEAVIEFHRLLLLSFVELVEAHIPSIRNCHSHNHLGVVDWEAFKATCRAVRPDGDSACVESVMEIDYF